MTQVAWPVRPEPHPGEPLTSYAVRLADANGLPRAMAIDRHRRDIDVPANELDTVAAIAGLDAGAAARLTRRVAAALQRQVGLSALHRQDRSPRAALADRPVPRMPRLPSPARPG